MDKGTWVAIALAVAALLVVGGVIAKQEIDRRAERAVEEAVPQFDFFTGQLQGAAVASPPESVHNLTPKAPHARLTVKVNETTSVPPDAPLLGVVESTAASGGWTEVGRAGPGTNVEVAPGAVTLGDQLRVRVTFGGAGGSATFLGTIVVAPVA